MKNMTNEIIGQYLLIILFLLILFLPFIDNIFNIFPKTELIENRQLANFPVIAGSNIWSFSKNFENYYNDNFGLRENLIKGNNILNIKLFSFSPNTRVVLGKENWLYYAQDESFYKYKKKFTNEELKLYVDILKNRKKSFSAQGIQYFVVIAPDKQSIYPEYLPEYIKKLNENSEYDQIIDFMITNHILDINIDIKKALYKEKLKGNTVYYITDSHWNEYGAFIAYQEIMKKLEIYSSELKIYPLDDFELDEKQYSGDMTRMIGMEDYFKEKAYFFIPKNIRKANIIEANSINGVVTKNPMLLSECHYCSNVTAVIIRDSQGIPLIPFLAEHFQRAIFIDRTFGENAEIIQTIIKREKPDIVLYEIVERGINEIFYHIPDVSLINFTDSIFEIKGIYKDRWTSKTASFKINAKDATKIKIKAFLSEEIFRKAYDNMLNITINIDGNDAGILKLTNENFNKGNLSFDMKVPENNENTTIEITLDKSFIPIKYNITDDERELGVLLQEINLEFNLT